MFFLSNPPRQAVAGAWALTVHTCCDWLWRINLCWVIMYTNQRSMRKTPTVVSRLFQHSPRQLRIARERLDKVELNPVPKREPADPHSVGRDRHEAEIRPSKIGHASTRFIAVTDNLVGSGAVVQAKHGDQMQKEPIETPNVKSSLHMENGFFQTRVAEQQNNSRKMCEGSAHGTQGHLDGASATQKKPSRSSIMPSDAEGWWETDDALFNRPLRGAGDPSFGAAHIQSMTDYLGAGQVDYKPSRKQIEHAGAEMLDAMQGAPAVLDLHGRPWVQKQRQHFSAEEVARNADRNVSANVKDVAENFRFEEHANVRSKLSSEPDFYHHDSIADESLSTCAAAVFDVWSVLLFLKTLAHRPFSFFSAVRSPTSARPKQPGGIPSPKIFRCTRPTRSRDSLDRAERST